MNFAMPTLRRAFLTGLLVLAPLGLTAWVGVWLFRSIDDMVRPLILSVPWVARSLPPGGIQGLGVLAALIVVTAVGFFANNLLGRTFFGLLDSLLARIPWVKGVYGAAKEISGVVFSDKGRAFRYVVAFEYPRRGVYSIGFVTSEPAYDGHDEFLHVFLPTSPNPTSGYFLLVPRKESARLSMAVEDGLKLIVSGGAVISLADGEDIHAKLAQLNEGQGA
ncbi:hypothetical protein DRQ53_00460 [bacterium]|nr:MAG: hypothetical protein DRQ32_00930 [bacterium]RKZ18540.1 MAG: hypothetical protein DRQ53_00460 [bacterium]